MADAMGNDMPHHGLFFLISNKPSREEREREREPLDLIDMRSTDWLAVSESSQPIPAKCAVIVEAAKSQVESSCVFC